MLNFEEPAQSAFGIVAVLAEYIYRSGAGVGYGQASRVAGQYCRFDKGLGFARQGNIRILIVETGQIDE